MNVSLLYFHTLRELTGCAGEQLQLPEGATVRDLVDLVVARHPRVAAVRPSLLVAVDLEFAAETTPLRAGAEVALMPPVSGG